MSKDKELILTGMTTCPQCGKKFPVLYPHLWAYKRKKRFLCSYSCLRAFDKKEETEGAMIMARQNTGRANSISGMTNEEMAKKILEIFGNGGNPLEWLESVGYKAPRQKYADIKGICKVSFPELYARFPAILKVPAPAEEDPKETREDKPVVELVYDESIAEEYWKEQEAKAADYADPPAAPMETIYKPLQFDGYTVRCIEGTFGKFYYDARYNLIDWTTPDGEEVSFSPKAWKIFATEELPKVMAILGVSM